MDKFVKTFQYGAHPVHFETGEMARQATAAVKVDMGGTIVLVTVVGRKEAKEGQKFFPLTVNYQERMYAAGKIPGGFLKREGRPSEMETLTCRLIDRPIRPLFPKGYMNEVQIVATVLSVNPEVAPDIPALLGASAALALSGMPFDGPLAAARVGYIDGEFVLNPSTTQMETSQLDLVVAGTETAVLMVESEADILPEQVMLDAVWFGHEQMQVALNAIKDLADEAGKEAWDWTPAAENETLMAKVSEQFADKIAEAYQVPEKTTRQVLLSDMKKAAIEAIAVEAGEPTSAEVASVFAKLEKTIVRRRILDGEPRIDGRDTRTVRQLAIRNGVLPRSHGSALFTRGETQALVVATLGGTRDAKMIDGLMGESRDTFMLHYNFPPYCVGECGMMIGPKRREIGHGKLAKRSLAAVLPAPEDFPYVLRVVSEITESNGSSSMATVCGTSLALMDAGVPIKAPVAGIAMGLVKEDTKFAVLTDILGDEDHLGDMDFKVAGTSEGITALQMDIKIQGITQFIMEKALEQAKVARDHILGHMNAVLDSPRTEVSETAPRIISFKIKPEKIREVIGKGGATIRALTEETGVNIDLDDDGNVTIFAADKAAGEVAKQRVEDIVADVEVGQVYEGKVLRLLDFGAIVAVMPGKDGLVHISQIAEERVEKVTDHLEEGQGIKVKVIEVDRQGRIRLSMKPSVLA